MSSDIPNRDPTRSPFFGRSNGDSAFLGIRKLFHNARERLFVVLDYDPTHVETGEVEAPSILSALGIWFYRTLWCHRIELGGVAFVVVLGYLCYRLVSAA